MSAQAADGTAGRQGRTGREASVPGQITAQALRATFGQWRLFEQHGTWWAIRGGQVTWDGPQSLLLRVITAADLESLAEKLCLQEWLDGLDPTALAAIYHQAAGREACR